MEDDKFSPEKVDEQRLRHDSKYRWNQGKQFIEFGTNDWERLRSTEPYLQDHLRGIVERLYQRFMEFEPTAKFYLHDDGRFDEESYEHRVHGFVLWLERIFQWPEDEKYINYLKNVAEIHTEELGFDHMVVHPFYMGPTFSILFEEIAGILGEQIEDPGRLARVMTSWQKFFQLQQSLIKQAYAGSHAEIQEGKSSSNGSSSAGVSDSKPT